MEEVWLTPYGYEGLYKVSNKGRVFGFKRGKFLSPTEEDTGYRTVCLSAGGIVTKFRLNVLVLSTFCGPAPFEGAHAAHNDGDRSNNALTNLRWASPAENQADVDRHGKRCRGTDVHSAVLGEDDIRSIRKLLAAGARNRPVAEQFGVSVSTIHLIRHNRIWRHVT